MSIDLAADRTQPAVTNDAGADDAQPAPFEYRALSSAAVSSLALGVLSCLALFDWWMATIPVLGAALGAFAIRQIRRRSDELVGQPLAKIGIVLSVLFLAAGWSRLSYVYATEVPPGYQRVSYADLQPEANVASQQVPQSALDLNDHKVFIKGFMYPGALQQGIRTFLLVRDQGTCCFGGNPKLTERIQVKLADEKSVSFSTGEVKFAGVFRVQSANRAVDGPGGVLYHLDEAMVR